MAMKEEIRTWLGAAGRYAPVGHLYRLMYVMAKCLAEPDVQARKQRAERDDEVLARELSPKFDVLHGPFAGLGYVRARSAGSALLPKILGCYERELHPVIERILRNEYTDVVDIGCAEGYYAVGLGMRLPQVTVHAFDTSPRARRLCAELAERNGIAARLKLGEWCDEAVLLGLELGPRALLLSDCEGYEAELFTPRVATHLARHDVLIEVHEQHDPELSRTLQTRFAATHDITAVESIDDRRKLRVYDFPELMKYDVRTRLRIVSEGRAGAMEWLYCSSKESTRGAANGSEKERTQSCRLRANFAATRLDAKPRRESAPAD